MQTYLTKSSEEMLAQHRLVNSLSRGMLRRYWKNQGLCLTLYDVVQSTKELMEYYENEIKNRNT